MYSVFHMMMPGKTWKGNFHSTLQGLGPIPQHLSLVHNMTQGRRNARTYRRTSKDRLGFYSYMASSTSKQVDLRNHVLVCPINFIFIASLASYCESGFRGTRLHEDIVKGECMAKPDTVGSCPDYRDVLDHSHILLRDCPSSLADL